MNYTRTYAEIDLHAVGENIRSIRALLRPETRLLVAVKSDAYGHGAPAVSRYIERHSLADVLGVATPMEGMELRQAGVTMPILNMGLVVPDPHVAARIVEHDIAQTVADTSLAELLARCAREKGKTAILHLKIDTGMGRIGCAPDEALGIAGRIAGLEGASLEGVFTHFPVSDDPSSDFTRRQIDIFQGAVNKIESRGIRVPVKHCANSAALLLFPESHFDMVRPGILAYGYLPAPNCNGRIRLDRSMSLKSLIVFVKRVKGGTPLSYGHIYATPRDTNIATVPVGYGDGYSRFLSNKGRVLSGGREYPVVGRVTMDQVMVDIGDDEFRPGEEVVVFGKEGVTVESLAAWMGTVPYEIICGISKRIPRVYINGDAP